MGGSYLKWNIERSTSKKYKQSFSDLRRQSSGGTEIEDKILQFHEAYSSKAKTNKQTNKKTKTQWKLSQHITQASCWKLLFEDGDRCRDGEQEDGVRVVTEIINNWSIHQPLLEDSQQTSLGT